MRAQQQRLFEESESQRRQLAETHIKLLSEAVDKVSETSEEQAKQIQREYDSKI
mgnify:FL=1